MASHCHDWPKRQAWATFGPTLAGHQKDVTHSWVHLCCRSELVQRIASSPTGILVTSFDQMRLQRDLLLDVPWGYAVLDEGHKIRNPDAEVCLPALPSAALQDLPPAS